MKTSFASAQSDNPSQLAASLREQLDGAQPQLVLAFASPSHPLEGVMAELGKAFDGTLLGASSSGEFTETGAAKQAIAACAIAGEFAVEAALGQGLSQDVAGTVSNATPTRAHDQYSHKTAIMMLDALTGAGEEAVLLTAGRLGPDVPLAGGAAGDDLAMKKGQIALGSTVADDAVVTAMIYSNRKLGLGVQHGHRPLSAPITVTRAEGNTVYELDNRPAWDVWRELTRDHAATQGTDVETLSGADVGAFLLRYEAGLAAGDTIKVRAPLTVGDNGSLGFACGLPQGAVFRITESQPDDQIASASGAAQRAAKSLGGPCAGAVVFDCICRNLILGDRFDEAVTGVSAALGNAKLAGFETYGEIALAAGDLSGFHNTTTVVLAIPD